MKDLNKMYFINRNKKIKGVYWVPITHLKAKKNIKSKKFNK